MDERIIALLQKRDESALQYIREAYGSLCLGLAVRILGNEADAEECLNDMLLDVWNQIPPDEPEYLRAYLLTIVRRRAVNRLKLENAKKRGGTQFTVALDELSELLPSGENVEHVVDQRALNHALEAFLRSLPQNTRRVFMLRYYAALPTTEIARRCGMQDGNVRTLLSRTRGAFQKYLRKEGFL